MNLDETALAASVSDLESRADRVQTSPENGGLVYHRWQSPGDGSENVLLVHGGSGSWTHWIRNIPDLRKTFSVVAVDLPGLGDSMALAPGYTALDAVDALERSLDEAPLPERFHLVAFSWGCAVSSQLAMRLPHRIQSLLLIGPASIGDVPRRGLVNPLIKRRSSMSRNEIYEINRENLARLMIHDRSRIDEMAVYVQTRNTLRARFNSPQFARSTLVLDGLRELSIPVKVLYGQHDAAALPDIAAKGELLRSVKPDLHFEIIPDAGHWLQYEKNQTFNALCHQWVGRL